VQIGACLSNHLQIWKHEMRSIFSLTGHLHSTLRSTAIQNSVGHPRSCYGLRSCWPRCTNVLNAITNLWNTWMLQGTNKLIGFKEAQQQEWAATQVFWHFRLRRAINYYMKIFTWPLTFEISNNRSHRARKMPSFTVEVATWNNNLSCGARGVVTDNTRRKQLPKSR